MIKGSCILVRGQGFTEHAHWSGHPPWRTIAKPGCHTLKHILVLLSAFHHVDSTHQQSLFSSGQALLSHKSLSKAAGVGGSHWATQSTEGWREGLCLFLDLLPCFRCPQRHKEKRPFSISDINSITGDKRPGQTERYNYFRQIQILQPKLCWFSDTYLPLAAFAYYKLGLTRLPSLKTYLVNRGLGLAKTSEHFKGGLTFCPCPNGR